MKPRQFSRAIRETALTCLLRLRRCFPRFCKLMLQREFIGVIIISGSVMKPVVSRCGGIGRRTLDSKSSGSPRAGSSPASGISGKALQYFAGELFICQFSGKSGNGLYAVCGIDKRSSFSGKILGKQLTWYSLLHYDFFDLVNDSLRYIFVDRHDLTVHSHPLIGKDNQIKY